MDGASGIPEAVVAYSSGARLHVGWLDEGLHSELPLLCIMQSCAGGMCSECMSSRGETICSASTDYMKYMLFVMGSVAGFGQKKEGDSLGQEWRQNMLWRRES
jgi:hypothetical protein